jgi:hypothetical protein
MSGSVTRRAFAKSRIALAAVLVTTAGSLPLTSAPARAEIWPSKPIKIICAYPAGGLADAFARAYGEYLSQKLGQPVIVENRAGATGSVGAVAVKQSRPDGYTLLIAINATLAQNRVLYKSLAYDPDKDFALISSMSPGHLPFVASKATGATNLKEFIEFARKNETNVGSFGAGSYAHIAVAELNKQRRGVGCREGHRCVNDEAQQEASRRSNIHRAGRAFEGLCSQPVHRAPWSRGHPAGRRRAPFHIDGGGGQELPGAEAARHVWHR